MDEALYLVRVIKQDVYDKLMALPPDRRLIMSTRGYAPEVEFPGVCTTLVTKNTLYRAHSQLYPGDIVLFLSRRLLEQRNYHLNIDDNWGCTSEWNTVYPWQLQRFLKHNLLAKAMRVQRDHVGNEVVFHDPIPWSMVCGVRQRFDLDQRTAWPQTPLVTSAEPDVTKLPCYLHSLLHVTLASLEHLQAVTALIDPAQADWADTAPRTEGTKEALHSFITDKVAQGLHIHRRQHRLDAFKARLPPMPRTFQVWRGGDDD